MSTPALPRRVIRACDAGQWDAEGRRIPLEVLADYRADQRSSPASAVIFDRDGVLNVDREYVHQPADFEWISGALEALQWLTDVGVEILVATNQGGIGRGLYDEDIFRTFTDWFLSLCAASTAHVRAVYYCPHHPSAVTPNLRRACRCRKPRPGQIEAATIDHGLARDRVTLVGDSDADMEAGRRAGVRTARYTGGSLLDLVVGLPLGPRV